MMFFNSDTLTPQRRRDRLRALTIAGVTAIAAVGVYFLLPPNVNELARRCAAIFVVAAIFWATEALPLYATSLCVLGMLVLFLASEGGVAEDLPGLSYWPIGADGKEVSLRSGVFFESFASPIIVLFMGGFLLSAAVSKHGLDKVIAAKVLRPFTGGPLRMILAVMFISGFLSMWMSNTATAAMMLAIVMPVVNRLDTETGFGRALILAVPFGANIGGLGTPIGTPPNAVALAAIRKAGMDVTFVDWMMLGLPAAFALTLIAGVMLFVFYPLKRPLHAEVIEKAGKVGVNGWLTGAVMTIAIAMWLTGNMTGIGSATVALLAAAALTALRLLDAKDVDSINWNILLLMWGGLSLGEAMQTTGLSEWIVGLPIGQLGGFALAAVIVVLASGLSTFMSNTAAATLIVPMAIALSPPDSPDLAILTAFACSFAMAMPVSTPPNAIAFATGRVTVGSLLKIGGLTTLIAILGLLAGYRLMIPMILH